MCSFVEINVCENRLKILSELKMLMSTKDGKEEVSNDLVAFYVFQNLILKVKMFLSFH